MKAQVKNLLNLSLKLIEEGKSTPETAFLDALKLERLHTEGMLGALAKSNAPANQPLTGYDEVYMGIIEEISNSVHAKINRKKIK